MIRLPPRIRDELVSHAREGAPLEVCGALSGVIEDEHEHAGRRRVERVYRAANVADDPRRRYALDPEQQYAILERIDDAGRDVVGFYHSHPRGPPGPSGIDRERATWSGRSYVIVVLDPDDPDGEAAVGSWRWTGEAFEREDVVIADEE